MAGSQLVWVAQLQFPQQVEFTRLTGKALHVTHQSRVLNALSN